MKTDDKYIKYYKNCQFKIVNIDNGICEYIKYDSNHYTKCDKNYKIYFR